MKYLKFFKHRTGLFNHRKRLGMNPLRAIKKHPVLFLLAAGIDFLFFLLLSQLHFRVFLSVADHMKNAAEMLAAGFEKLSLPNIEQLDVLQNPVFIIHYHAILQGIIFFFTGLFLLWLILRGTTWFLAHKILETKISVKKFIIRFTCVTIFGTVLTFLLILGLLLLVNYANFSILPIITPGTAHLLSFALLLTLHYAYSLAIASIKNLREITSALNTRTVIVYLISVLWYIIATSITLLLSYQSFALSILAVILVMPTLTFCRCAIIKKITIAL